MRRRLKGSVAAMLGCALLGVGCGNDQSTAPTPTPAVPTITENWTGTLAKGGTRFYSYNVSQLGTINVTLVSVGGASVDSTVTVGLANGTPAGTGCSTSNDVTVAARSTPQLSVVMDSGVHCAKIYDVGNLVSPADFAITIAHP
jgi:ABC-type glycerol-3-phosphate transport system substrate-binding protein